MKKKKKLLIILMMLISLSVSASFPMLDDNPSNNTRSSSEIAEGFYHIKNTGTGRYLSFNDTDPGNYPVSESGSVNLNGICTYFNYDSVAVSPSCVIYVKQLGNGTYDLLSQGSSINAMSGEKITSNIKSNGDGSYKIWWTYNRFTKWLTDMSPSNKDAHLTSSDLPYSNWTFEPINTSNEYIGIRPDVKTADGSYFGTIYAGFNFKLASSGMVAYYVSNAGGKEFTMKKIGSDVIPAGTPVIIKCNSADPRDNKIKPVVGNYTFSHSNSLRGVYCSLYVAGHHNVTRFDDFTMRILGLNNKGELAFIADPALDRLYKEQYLMANKAYLVVKSSDADVLKASIDQSGKPSDEPQNDEPQNNDPQENVQDVVNCIVIETIYGERIEYYLSTKPQLRHNNDKVTLTYKDTKGSAKTYTVEFSTKEISKVYISESTSITSIEDLPVNKSDISVEAGVVRLTGFRSGEIVRVFSLDGKLLSETAIPQSGELSISVASLPQGVNIININNKSIKIIRQ